MILISSHRFTEHVTPPGHPESLERAEVCDAVAEAFRQAGGVVLPPRPATREELERVHTARHVALIEATAGRPSMLDADTFTSPASYEIARLAAGAAVDAARASAAGTGPVLALVRPPGHHAEPDRPMGFCLFNNVAIAAAALRADGIGRVAIVDIDVHHGNGTQEAFYRDSTVLYVSSHQAPFYPGTGAATETGAGEGEGFTLNIPLAAGATDEIYRRAYDGQVIPALTRFRPDVILVSAGFDAHERDPLARMRMTTAGYGDVMRLIRSAADELCGGRTAFVLEGGYHLGALQDCLHAAVRVLS